MIKNQLFIASALIVGVAIGYVMKPDAPTEGTDDAADSPASKIADAGESASTRALRGRIAELERLLAEKTAAQTTEVKPTPDATAQEKPRMGPPSMKEMRERMEKMAKEDPERFAQITNRMTQWRQRRIERAHTKLDFLASVDTSAMTPEQKKNHEAYQDLLVRREELEEKMANPEMTDEDREDILRDMRETGRILHATARREQEALLDQTVKSLGFTGDDATEIRTTFQDILSVTETREGPGGGGPGGPPPGNMPNAK